MNTPRTGTSVAEGSGWRLVARKVLQSPIFWGGLLTKLVLAPLLASTYLHDLFVPMVNYFVESGGQDPWSYFHSLGRLRQFPYPPLMLYLVSTARALGSPFFAEGTFTVSHLHLFAMRVPLLLADLVLTGTLISWFPNHVRKVLLLFWCSPVVIYVCYWHGQLDIVPTALFFVALALLRKDRFLLSTLFLGLMLATKTHLIIALPFVALYAAQRIGWRSTLLLVLGALAIFVLLQLPYLTRDSFWDMVYKSPEQARLFSLRVGLGGAQTIYLAPFALVVIWLRLASYRKINADLLMMYLGIGFAVFITLVPPQPAYILWSLPFVVCFIVSERRKLFGFAVLSASYFLYFGLRQDSDFFAAWRVVAPTIADWGTPALALQQWLSPGSIGALVNLSFTVMVGSMVWLTYDMYRWGVRSNEVYRERTTPVMIGIAGDSGTGKGTLSRDLAKVFGADQTLVLSGDDYHRWPRGHEMWDVYTHLNVEANDLHRQAAHAAAISAGRCIVKGSYDHHSGQFKEQERVDPRDYVIIEGLHTLSNETLRGRFDLTVFLNPSEPLRRAWKVRRDSHERGYTPEEVLAALEARDHDRLTSVLPQREVADLVFEIEPCSPIDVMDTDTPLPGLSLAVKARNSFDLRHLVEALGRHAALTVEHRPFKDTRWQELRIDGDVEGGFLRDVCRTTIPNSSELAIAPDFEGGSRGLQQIIMLACLSEKLRQATALPQPGLGRS